MRFHPATTSALFASALAAASGLTYAKPSAARHPIPEYGPVQAVVLAEDLFQYDYQAAELVEGILAAGAEVWVATPETSGIARTRRALKTKLKKPALDRISVMVLPHRNIWLRDAGPLSVVREGPKGADLLFADLLYDVGQGADDALPRALGAKVQAPVETIDVAIDGGNFLVAGDLCLTSGPVAGNPPVPNSTLSATQAMALGCRDVLVIQDPPHTHLDMWAKVVDDRRILVNEITDKTLAVAQASGFGPETKELKVALDRVAGVLASRLEVIRIPMPIPFRGVFRTYANALLLNGHALVPTYKSYGWNYAAYPDQTLAGYYEDAVVKAYRRAGFAPRLINADGMIFNGGAFHCVSISLPRPFSQPSSTKGM